MSCVTVFVCDAQLVEAAKVFQQIGLVLKAQSLLYLQLVGQRTDRFLSNTDNKLDVIVGQCEK